MVRVLDFSASALHKLVVNHRSERIFRVGNRDADFLVLLQRQWLQGPKDPILIHGFNLTVHLITIVRRNGGVLCCTAQRYPRDQRNRIGRFFVHNPRQIPIPLPLNNLHALHPRLRPLPLLPYKQDRPPPLPGPACPFLFMATIQQIEANRLNAQKSTGPRSVEGKAVSCFNAIKTGIDAKSQIVRGEDPADLQTLTAEYQQRWQPATPEQRLLVDTLIDCEWLLRRFRKSEAQLWHCKMQEAEVWKPDPGSLLGLAFNRGCEQFSRLQRRIDSTSRNYHRALKELQRLDSERCQPDPPPAPASEASPPPGPWPPAPGPASEASPAPAPASEASLLPPSETNLRNEPNSGIASLADAPSSPAPASAASLPPGPDPQNRRVPRPAPGSASEASPIRPFPAPAQPSLASIK